SVHVSPTKQQSSTLCLLTCPPPSATYALSLHAALPISMPLAANTALVCLRDAAQLKPGQSLLVNGASGGSAPASAGPRRAGRRGDRKSTRLNSSHVANSYAVFCVKKKNNKTTHCPLKET